MVSSQCILSDIPTPEVTVAMRDYHVRRICGTYWDVAACNSLSKGKIIVEKPHHTRLRVLGHGYCAALKECVDLGFMVNSICNSCTH